MEQREIDELVYKIVNNNYIPTMEQIKLIFKFPRLDIESVQIGIDLIKYYHKLDEISKFFYSKDKKNNKSVIKSTTTTTTTTSTTKLPKGTKKKIHNLTTNLLSSLGLPDTLSTKPNTKPNTKKPFPLVSGKMPMPMPMPIAVGVGGAYKKNKNKTIKSTNRKKILKKSTSYSNNRQKKKQKIITGGAYKGNYVNNTVNPDTFKAYLKTLLDKYKTDDRKTADGTQYNISTNEIKEILQDILTVNDATVNTEINSIIEHNLIDLTTITDSTSDNAFDVNLNFIPKAGKIDIYERINDEELLNLLTLKIYGFYNHNILYGEEYHGGFDVLAKYYYSDIYGHITKVYNLNIYGMGKPVPIEEPYISADKKILFKYLILMNFLRLCHGITYYVNINPKNDSEKIIWNYGLGMQLAPNGNSLHNTKSRYLHLEVRDFTAYSLRYAIYLLMLFENNDANTIFHCSAGFGRTGSTMLFLALAKNLCQLLRNSDIDGAEYFCKTYLFDENFDNLKCFLSNHYNDNKNEIVKEVFHLNHIFCQRMNTIKIAILYYITKMKLYNEKINQKFYLNYFNVSTNTLESIEYTYKLETFITNFTTLKTSNPDVLGLFFNLLPYTGNNALTGLDALNGTNFPDNINDIGIINKDADGIIIQ